MKLLWTGLAIGACAGLLGALCGVGGGLVMVPLFGIVLGFPQKQAVATSMAVIILTALAATANNARHPGLIDWKTVAVVGLSSALAAWLGADLMRALSNQALTRLFALLLIGVGLHMLWRS
jgi:uncharacterized membrane protein YfcA